MAKEQRYGIGDKADKDLKLFVKDSNGNTIGEIDVPKGNVIPPTRIEGAQYYSTQK